MLLIGVAGAAVGFGLCPTKARTAAHGPIPDHPVAYGEEGVVSWYGYDHIGRRTASMAWFNPERLTAAHKSLPLGSVVRVTRLDNGLSVRVTINDRGPYIEGRIIDLSRRAAKELDLIEKGIAPCRVEVLRPPLRGKGGARS